MGKFTDELYDDFYGRQYAGEIRHAAEEKAKREKKQNILTNDKLTDMEKLRRVFDISKDSLKEYDSQLYYAILAVLDKDKTPDASGYFNT